jgi:hypothetical protein
MYMYDATVYKFNESFLNVSNISECKGWLEEYDDHVEVSDNYPENLYRSGLCW